MRVEVFNENGELRDILKNVTEVKHCKDGRHLVYYQKKCDSCKQSQAMVYQVPATMTVTVKPDIAKIEALRERVWGLDIPHPTTPDGRDFHERILKILKHIDTQLLKEE